MLPVPSIPETPPVGFATKLGVIVAALAPLLGALATVLDGDQTPEALGALGVAAFAVYGVIRGRSDQAAAITEAKGQAHVAAAAVQAAELNSNPAQTLTPLSGTVSGVEGRTSDVGGHPEPPRITFDHEAADDLRKGDGEDVAESEGVLEFDPEDPSAIPPDVGDTLAVGVAA